MLAGGRDRASHDSAAKIAEEVSRVGAKEMRLRAPDGTTEWDDALKVHGADVLRSSLAIIEQNGGGENPGFPDLKRLETAQRGKQRPFSQIAGQSNPHA